MLALFNQNATQLLELALKLFSQVVSLFDQLLCFGCVSHVDGTAQIHSQMVFSHAVHITSEGRVTLRGGHGEVRSLLPPVS